MIHSVFVGLIRHPWNNYSASFDIDSMANLLDHDNHEMRKKFRTFVSDPIMTPRYDISLAEERDVALARLKRICDVSALLDAAMLMSLIVVHC